MLAGAFRWEDGWARRLRPALWTAAVICLIAAVSPYPPLLDRLAEHHTVVLALFAVSAGAAARLPGRQAPLREWLASVGG